MTERGDACDPFLAAYAQFAATLAGIPDLKAQELRRVALAVPAFVARARACASVPGDDDVANGLAQGLLELPLLFDEVDGHWRWSVSRALHEALVVCCPGLLLLESQRLREVLARGSIATLAELLLVRHCIHALEGKAELAADLKSLHALAQAWDGPD